VALLGPADLFQLQFIRDARLSPDGCCVAYAVSRIDGEERVEIWVADIAAGGRCTKLPFVGKATAPRWSPDGRSIAFVGDGSLRLLTLSSFSVSEPLTPEHLSVQGAATWCPDGNRLAVSLLKHRVIDGPKLVTKNHFRADGFGFLDIFEQRLYEVEVASARLRCLTPAESCCSQPEWGPCGRRILFLANERAAPYALYSPRLLTVDAEDGEILEVLRSPWYVASACWLRDGEHIVIAAAHESALTVPTLSLWVVTAEGADARLRTPGLSANIGFRAHHDMPARDLTHGNIITVGDGETAYVTVQNRGSGEIYRVSLRGEISVERVLTGSRSCIVLDVHCTTDLLLYAVTELYSPTELWASTLTGSRERRLTSLNDRVLDYWPTFNVETFSFQSSDGLSVDCWYLAPPERASPLPTILFIHGGPYGAVGYAFCFDFHLLLAHGFGIVFANFRGSSGYGESFASAIMGDWGRSAYPDHVGTVDAAVRRGLADPARLGVWGASYGGFATCWIVSHTSRFKAAVAESACTNLTTLYYQTDLPEVFCYDLGGRPHELPDVYRACSPLTYAHRCVTPTLLIHGEDDLRCPISESEQFHRVLQDVGCPASMLRIPGSSHLGDSTGPLFARLAQNEALLSWFQRHL
jgi:dipeptidyl aminopeptidase/acylaminoacyl peptidase